MTETYSEYTTQTEQIDQDFLQTKWWILLNCPQTSKKWLNFRRARPTGSVVGSISGHNNYPDQNPADQLLYMSGQKKKVFSATSLAHMKRGRDLEDGVRMKYMQANGFIAIEIGLALATWDTRLGASVDGVVISPQRLDLVDNTTPWQQSPKIVDSNTTGMAQITYWAEGILEIKCPARMYN